METNQSTSSNLKLDLKDEKYAQGRRKIQIEKVWLKKETGKIKVIGKILNDNLKRLPKKLKLQDLLKIINNLPLT